MCYVLWQTLPIDLTRARKSYNGMLSSAFEKVTHSVPKDIHIPPTYIHRHIHIEITHHKYTFFSKLEHELADEKKGSTIFPFSAWLSACPQVDSVVLLCYVITAFLAFKY